MYTKAEFEEDWNDFLTCIKVIDLDYKAAAFKRYGPPQIARCLDNYDNILKTLKETRNYLTAEFEPDKALIIIENTIAKIEKEI